MQAWADRNADAIGAKLAEHTFSHASSGQFLKDYADAKGIPVSGLKKGWGSAQAGHFKAIFSEAAKPSGFGVSYFEGLLGVGALHSRINLPLKWFLGTYPVFIDLVHEAMVADTPEPARKTTRKFGRSVESVDLAVLADAERAISRVFNYDSQAIVEAFYYHTFSSMGVNLKMMGDAGSGRDISDMFAKVRDVMHETLSSFGASTIEVQEMCEGMNVRLSETGQAINELSLSASRVAEGASRQAEVATPWPRRGRPGHGRRLRRQRALAHRHLGRDRRHRFSERRPHPHRGRRDRDHRARRPLRAGRRHRRGDPGHRPPDEPPRAERGDRGRPRR